MSIFSNLLKKKLGISEIDLSTLPLGSILIQELQKNGVKQVFKALSDDDMKIIDKAVQIELYHRKTKPGNAGIGKGYE